MPNSLRTDYESRFPILLDLKNNLEKLTKRVLNNIEHIDRISYRVKDSDSFIDKATDPENDPPYSHPLAEIEDQVAGRIIVFFRDDLDIVRNKLQGTFNTVEFERRRPSADAEFGYESNHLIFNIPPLAKTEAWEKIDGLPETFELQIRTVFMHAYAEPQHDFGYKSAQELPQDIRRELAWIAASAWGADQAFSRVYRWWKENFNN